ncbi:unnamed protein product [Vitrella brassicaformis CCMP3155]|uniref:Uncharacterized protein n=2 Tax=Vitrella brassicaformis TaxID=1169539 RepID=A0A0G4EGD1_VITBC|nr:unnamed protein product [Vitrella brassicaformis CCMP3155]|eukprot:CEL94454.1 unnamed protein product [Vitrella brassicaformis CCMP3155]
MTPSPSSRLNTLRDTITTYANTVERSERRRASVWRHLHLAYRVVGFFCFFYLFLVALKFLTVSLLLLSVTFIGPMIERSLDQPFLLSMFVGVIVSTCMLSHTTASSILVSMVATQHKALSVRHAIPLLLGANIGTTIGPLLVSFTQVSQAADFKNAFRSAALHHMVNALSVLLIFPLEWSSHFLELSAKATAMVIWRHGHFVSPIDAIVSPLQHMLIELDHEKLLQAEVGGAVEGSLVKGGVLKGEASDNVAGALVLLIALLGLIVSALGMVGVLRGVLPLCADRLDRQYRLSGTTGRVGAVVVGLVCTVLFHSSTVVVSLIALLVGVGTLSFVDSFPLILGANLGSTFIPLLAASFLGRQTSVVLALLNLFFKTMMICIWYVIVPLRSVPLLLAYKLGGVVIIWRWFAVLYVLVAFIVIPLSLIAITTCLTAANPLLILLGVILLLLFIAASVGSVWWWKRCGGREASMRWFHFTDMTTFDVDRDEIWGAHGGRPNMFAFGQSPRPSAAASEVSSEADVTDRSRDQLQDHHHHHHQDTRTQHVLSPSLSLSLSSPRIVTPMLAPRYLNCHHQYYNERPTAKSTTTQPSHALSITDSEGRFDTRWSAGFDSGSLSSSTAGDLAVDGQHVQGGGQHRGVLGAWVQGGTHMHQPPQAQESQRPAGEGRRTDEGDVDRGGRGGREMGWV